MLHLFSHILHKSFGLAPDQTIMNWEQCPISAMKCATPSVDLRTRTKQSRWIPCRRLFVSSIMPANKDLLVLLFERASTTLQSSSMINDMSVRCTVRGIPSRHAAISTSIWDLYEWRKLTLEKMMAHVSFLKTMSALVLWSTSSELSTFNIDHPEAGLFQGNPATPVVEELGISFANLQHTL